MSVHEHQLSQAAYDRLKSELVYLTTEWRIDIARKIERELGWKPAETFETGIAKTVRWYLDNAAWVANVQSGAYRDWVSRQYGP